MTVRLPAECPVCQSPYMALARRIKTARAGEVDLFYCMECESFCSPFAPEINGPTLNHHKQVFERNQEFTTRFMAAVLTHIKPRHIVDVGSGIGSFLYAVREQYHIDGVGFDLDIEACNYGRERYGLDLRGEAWTSKTSVGNVDLITCIMVLEHLKWPRPLLAELIESARRHKCHLFVSVPWFNRTWWKHLQDPLASGSPIEAPWVHVTHFSELGFVKVCQALGAKDLQRVSGVPWPGYLMAT